MITRLTLFLAALVLASAAIARSTVHAASGSPPPVATSQHAEPGGASQPPASEAGGEEHGAPHEGSWGPVIAKAVNFAILVGVLVYFLRVPLAAYLDGRITKVREDLVTAAQTRETASRQLADIDSRLKALPGELEALKRRGAEDLAAERVRIERAAETERQRLLEHTRREIDMRLRVARRELLELTANLAVGIAAERVTRSITPEDQSRMIDRYASQLVSAGGHR